MTDQPTGREHARTSPTDPALAERHARYWQRNLRYVWILLVIWFVVSYGFGILLKGPLDTLELAGGLPLGFWFAQQGSIYVFVALIFAYVYLMNRLDREFGVEEDA
ncbi:MAG TPA: DUF4212 domain-containing protein [Longimicrobiales bacterium]|nr:DUF4212 domain-containing protein [Longimicrobiales bacterium]